MNFKSLQLLKHNTFWTPMHIQYENLPMQYTENFFSLKKWKFHWKNFDIFLIFAQNIDCGYT